MTDSVLHPIHDALLPAQAREAVAWLRARTPAGAQLRADSRTVRPGDAFFALPGLRDDGRRFVDDAIARGASVVLLEAGGHVPAAVSVPYLALQGLRAFVGPIASEFHGRPSERMRTVAVTGTNGKTSVTQWVAHGAASMQIPAAVVGTLGSGMVGQSAQPGLTTPDAPEFQALLARFAAQGAQLVAAEASSIGLDQLRMNGTRLDVAAFTNLTRDHLDYHLTMDAYADAKARLFAWPGLRAAVVNGDDPASVRMLDALGRERAADGGTLRVVYGFAPGQYGAAGDATLIAERSIDAEDGMLLTLGGDFGRAELKLSILGRFNVSNALAVAGCWLALGLEFDAVVRALESLQPVPGRMQTIELPKCPLVVVDYAHSPDALANVLESLRPVAIGRGGRLWCVFGAGGGRDPGKRPMMGMIAERGADALVITSDNPRDESAFRIVSDIRAGLTREPELTALDRGVAIREALSRAAPADVVLIAGKGHETYQEIAGVRHPFSDTHVARQAMGARQEVSRV